MKDMHPFTVYRWIVVAVFVAQFIGLRQTLDNATISWHSGPVVWQVLAMILMLAAASKLKKAVK